MPIIVVNEATKQVLIKAVKYAISRNANIWSEIGYDDGDGVNLEDALEFLNGIK